MRKIRLVNETGSGHNTKIIDEATGKHIDFVSEVRLHPIRMNEIMQADLTMYVQGLSLLCNADVRVVCPHCGEEMICKLDSVKK